MAGLSGVAGPSGGGNVLSGVVGLSVGGGCLSGDGG